jgi:hypothetical protein
LHADSASLPNDLFVFCAYYTPNPKGEVTRKPHGYAVSDGSVEAVVVVMLDMERAMELVPKKTYFVCLHNVNFTIRCNARVYFLVIIYSVDYKSVFAER